MLIRNLLSKFTHLNPVPRVLAIASIGVAFVLSLSLILDGFVNLHIVLQENETLIAESQNAAVIAAKRGKSGEDVAHKPTLESNRIIVKFKEGSALPPGLAIAEERANLEKAEGLVKVLSITDIGAEVYQVPDDSTVEEVLRRITTGKRDLVEYAEIDMLVPADIVPNDQYFPNQWHHTNLKSTTGWDTTLGGGVTIAILDSGVDANHSDLAFSDVSGWNFYDNNANSSDVHGHGTKVAGAAATLFNNAIGVAGVAPEATILPIRISDASAYAYFSAMANGVTYAANNGARIANISYHGACGSSAVLSAARYMRSKGGVVVASAGNSGADNGFAASADLTCVSATGSGDLRTSWSSYGASTDVTAPGSGIYTTVRGGGYGGASGTSFSSPIVAGVYALLFSANPALTPAQADNIIFSTADDVGEAGWDMYYGYGRVNIEKALALAVATTGNQDTPDTTAPSAPANFRATSVSSNALSLAWNAATDDRAVTQYAVYRGGTKIATVGGTTYTNSGLTAETTYAYTVRAEDAAGNQSPDSATLSLTTPTAPFAISSYSIPTKTATSATATVTLTKPGTVTIKYGTSASMLSTTVQSTVENSSHSVTLPGLVAGTTYYYQVVANASGAATITSAVSSFKTPRATTSGGGKKR